MKKVIVALLCVGLLVLAGCSSSEPESIESVEGIVGTWNRVGGDFVLKCRYEENGTYICASTLNEIASGEGFKGDYWFEDGSFHDQVSVMPCSELGVGIYEVNLQGNGSLKFELIEDGCPSRIAGIAGEGDEEGAIEWEPVP